MSSLRFAINSLIWLNVIQSIISQETNKYCQLNSECELESHIGCDYGSLRSSGYEIEHLRYYDRLSILNQLNQFRSDLAVGNSRFRAEPFPNMKKILWNYELEKLLKLSIRKTSNVRFPCVITSESERITQFYFVLDKPKETFSIEKTFTDIISDIISRAFNSHKSASIDDDIAYSYVFNPETSTMGCAIGSRINSGPSSSLKSILIRCAFNGTKVNKEVLKNYIGWPCSECTIGQIDCDEFFPGLCVPGILKGYKGEQGTNGSTGSFGVIGVKGDAGEKGDDGEKGERGLLGPKGDLGIKGDFINIVSKGAKGNKGETATGSPGRTGIRGKTGADGIIGKQGMSGRPGNKGDHNHNKGEKGNNGIATAGDKGDKGSKGFPGNYGLMGQRGRPGEKGFSPVITRERLLENCNECPDGPPGARGPTGNPGPKGISLLNKQN